MTTALFAPVFAPYDPLEVDTDVALTPPSAQHLLGTDELGRDILSRLIYGSQVSLTVSLGAVFISIFLGILVGLTSAYFAGKYDMVMSRVIDGLL